MEHGASAASAIATAVEAVASSMECDLVCGSSSPKRTIGNRSERVDEENKSPSKNPQRNESLAQQQQRQDKRSQPNGMQQQQRRPSAGGSVSSFPQIDVNIDSHMNIDVSVNMENFDFDFHALPVEIQMALEDTLLGWTHLTSITLGHILLPWLVYYTVKRTSKYVLETTVYTLVMGQTSASGSASSVAMTTTTTALEGDFELHAIETVLVSPTTHVIMGVVAAIAAFRVIRNRRRVWFRHAYGSEGYNECEESRLRYQRVLEADNRRSSLLSLTSNNNINASSSVRSTQTWTSRVFTNYKRKRHRNKLKKASDRFERHHAGLSPKTIEMVTTSRQSNPRRQKFWRGSDYDSSTATSVAPTVDDCYDSSSSEDWDEDKTEMPSNGNRMSSIAHDAVCIPRIHNIPYAHGGFFGAAPFFLADRFWVGILRELLPDVYVEISRRVGCGNGFYFSSRCLRIGNCRDSNFYRSDASKLIHWAENNPVVAAYGVVMDLQIKQELAAKSILKTSNKNSNLTEGNTSKTPKKIDAIHDSGSSGNIIDQFYQNTRGKENSNENHNIDVLSTHNNSNDTDNTDNAIYTEKIVIPNLEWDIFVDPQLVRRVEAVLDAMDRYISSKKNPNSNSSTNTTTKPNDSEGQETKHHTSSKDIDRNGYKDDDNDNDIAIFNDEDSGKNEAAALLADHDHNNSNNTCNSVLGINVDINNLCGNSAEDICNDCFQSASIPSDSSHQIYSNGNADACDKFNDSVWRDSLKNDPVLRYLELELERRTQVLTDRLLIAHGNVLQLITEQAGFLKDWNYSRVQRTRRTLGGGMYARQWMAVFAESLRLGMKPPSQNSNSTGHNNNIDSIDDISGKNNDEEEKFNFYDEDEYDEVDALLPQRRQDQQNDPVDKNRDLPLEDDHDHYTCAPRACLDTAMEESLRLIEKITQSKQPIGILLDLKSRHVPKRVLTLMVNSLQKSGIRVVGIASFNISDIRGVGSIEINKNNGHNNPQIDCYDNKTVPANQKHHAFPLPLKITTPNNSVKEILMVHSAGDLQAACDEGLVRPGDHVFFNGGSLILDSARSSTLKAMFGFFFDMCACGYYSTFDPCVIEEGYRIQSYGYACSSMDAVETAACFANDDPDLMGGNHSNVLIKRKNVHGLQHKANYDYNHSEDEDNDTDDSTLIISSSSDDTEMGAVMKTLADYKKYYGFSMGLYLQEFSIDEAAANLLINLVNQNPKLYNLGLAWGGINGMTVHGIQPGRFTSTDGYWMQRQLGLNWKDPF